MVRANDNRGLAPDGREGDVPPVLPRGHRRPSWVPWALLLGAYAVGGVLAHLLEPWLSDLTMWTYATAEVGGALFIAQYVRTEWRTHPWGRHVMAFMVCLEVLFTLALSRRVFGNWPGLEEVAFLASATFAAIVWWRAWLQFAGERMARRFDND